MRPFVSWPRWALRALAAALVVANLMPGLLWRVELELWERDVVEWAEDIDVARAWRCAPIEGVQ